MGFGQSRRLLVANCQLGAEICYNGPTVNRFAEQDSLQLWHERLGHVNVAGAKRMIKKKDID